MTEYELVDAWLTHWVVAISIFVAFISATSALVKERDENHRATPIAETK